MSVYWKYRCETCDEELDFSLNHGEGFLTALYRHRDIFIKALELTQKDPHLWRIEVRTGPEYGESPIEFLGIHAGHRIVLHNEYGQSKPVSEPEQVRA